MSTDELQPASSRAGMAWVARIVAWIAGGFGALLILLIAGIAWYSTTADFQTRISRQIVATLEDSTGGRVEIAGVHFSLWHLALEVDGLVIHGLEGPGEAPYFSADKIDVRIRITSFFAHAAHVGLASHIGLNLLRVEHPQIHLIVDKDGHTNQPVPRHPQTSSEPIQDTLLDLQATEADLVQGVFLFNDRPVPFDLAARDVNAQVKYVSSSDRYSVALDLADLRTKIRKMPEAQSRLHLEGELGRDMVQLTKLDFQSGTASVLHASATLTHFAHPEWKAKASGTLELKQVSTLTSFEGLTGGSVDLDLNGHSCDVTPAVAQTHHHFWQRKRPPLPANPAAAKLPPSPECSEGYLVVGSAKVHKAGFSNEYVRLHDVDGGSQLHITPTELLLTALTGYLPGGGSAAGELRIEDWLGEAPAKGPSKSPTAAAAVSTANKTAATLNAKPIVTSSAPPIAAHAYLSATVNAIPLRTIMEITEPNSYGDLGFDTAVTGPVKMEWGGPATDIADTVIVDGNLKFRPTGVRRRGALNNVPMSGEAVAHYDGRREVVNIQHVILLTPESSTEASGVLGVNQGDPLTNLKVDMTVRDLGEFDQLLQTLGLSANGKKGTAAVPVVLHGGVVFHGTAAGRASDLDLKGHLEGTNLEVKLDSYLDTLIDSVVANAEFSYDSGLAIASSTIKRGNAVLNVTGSVVPRKIAEHRGTANYDWDEGTSVQANVKLANASVADVLEMAGQQQRIPATGTIDLTATMRGTLADPDVQGHIALAKGAIYGEPYDSLTANVAMKGKDLEATQAVLSLHGVQVHANGGYDLGSKHLHGHIEGNNLQLAKFQTFSRARPDMSGILTFNADADGTIERPGLKAQAKLVKVTAGGKLLGDISADLHSQDDLLYYTAQSTLIGAKIDASGQTQLTGGYQTQAKLTLSGFDAGVAVALFSSSDIQAKSSIGGTLSVHGPLAAPRQLSGTADLNNFDVKLQGIELTSSGPVRVSLNNGIASLDQVHITGQDTDLTIGGTVQAFGATDPNGGQLNLNSKGSVSVTLAHTFDSDILSSGKVEFSVAAGGRVRKPAFTGRVQFDNVNLAMEGIPNGLSALNGTLVFSQDRLQVESLSATTGGGKLKLGGFLTYRNGIYADLTATGDNNRVRLYGLSATANTNLRLQGGLENMLLSGTVLITRFGVGPDVDFAAFSNVGQVSAPPDPNSPSDKIRLDVRITSSPQLDFQNSYAKLAGTVDLRVAGSVAEPSLLGRIQITEGSATFAGTKYELQRGDIYFTNPVRIDPVIDIDATARVETYDITIGLQGTMSHLKPTYRSEPPLSEADIFALLALGRTQEEAQLYQEQEVQQGADPTTSALLGGALNATVSSRIGKLFGGGTVKIDPAFVGTLGNSTARITVQKQITRQLIATYATNVNSTAEPLLQGEYDLTPNVSLVVARDESGVFSVVYKIRRRYR
ncbi:MAG TPA: translocation/assembly module TamB domain-containing protein [Acidobacteriaceae bacterium]|nr:translocation/assembly module TamB domain-containing protein [Acidobacteriaceae bacterium]